MVDNSSRGDGKMAKIIDIGTAGHTGDISATLTAEVTTVLSVPSPFTERIFAVAAALIVSGLNMAVTDRFWLAVNAGKPVTFQTPPGCCTSVLAYAADPQDDAGT